MIRWSAWMMMAIGVLHMLLLGNDALPAIPGWAEGHLWSMAHTVVPPAERPFELVVSTDAFWSTIGGFAILLFVLGGLILWMDRQNYPVPAFVGWGIGVWALLGSVVMQPSGFPLGLVVAALLIIGARKRARSMGQ